MTRDPCFAQRPPSMTPDLVSDSCSSRQERHPRPRPQSLGPARHHAPHRRQQRGVHRPRLPEQGPPSSPLLKERQPRQAPSTTLHLHHEATPSPPCSRPHHQTYWHPPLTTHTEGPSCHICPSRRSQFQRPSAYQPNRRNSSLLEKKRELSSTERNFCPEQQW